tara:strand:+ start:230 stop:481 length:252 start_codon:yes stop_codon:yes gene_type:complete
VRQIKNTILFPLRKHVIPIKGNKYKAKSYKEKIKILLSLKNLNFGRRGTVIFEPFFAKIGKGLTPQPKIGNYWTFFVFDIFIK